MVRMKQRTILIALTAATLLGAAGVGIGASVTSQPSLMTQSDYESLRAAVAKVGEDDEKACEALQPLRRQACLAEVRAATAVHFAELETKYRGTVKSAHALQLARIDAAYTKSRGRCVDMDTYKRDSCVVAAHAERAKAKVAAHAGRPAGDTTLFARAKEDVAG